MILTPEDQSKINYLGNNIKRKKNKFVAIEELKVNKAIENQIVRELSHQKMLQKNH